MDFFEQIGDTISSKGKVVADKAKTLAEIASLKSQIASCEAVIKKNYMEIGQQYYEEYSHMTDAPFEKQCQAISNARKGMHELQARIDELKSE